MLPEGSCIVAPGADERHEFLHQVKIRRIDSLDQNRNVRGQLFSHSMIGHFIFGLINKSFTHH
jgi:hypothetical protein